MVKFLVKRILFLILFLAAIFVMPVAAWAAALIYVVLFGFSLIKQGASDSVGPKETVILIILGFFALSRGFNFIQEILLDEVLSYFIMIAVCCVAVIVGGNIFRRFVRADRDDFYMDSKIDNLTKAYPIILIASGVIRIVLEAALSFFSDFVAPYSQYLDFGIKAGIFLFALSIAMYIGRMIHIFQKNR